MMQDGILLWGVHVNAWNSLIAQVHTLCYFSHLLGGSWLAISGVYQYEAYTYSVY